MKDKQLMTTGDVARYCGVNFRTVIRWIDKGRLDAFKLPGRGDNRIPVESFITFLHENNIPIPTELIDIKPLMLLLTDFSTIANDVSSLARRQNWRMQVCDNPMHFGFSISHHQPSAIVITESSQVAPIDKILKEENKKNCLRILLNKSNQISALKTNWDNFRWPSDQRLFSDLLYHNAPQPIDEKTLNSLAN